MKRRGRSSPGTSGRHVAAGAPEPRRPQPGGLVLLGGGSLRPARVLPRGWPSASSFPLSGSGFRRSASGRPTRSPASTSSRPPRRRAAREPGRSPITSSSDLSTRRTARVSSSTSCWPGTWPLRNPSREGCRSTPARSCRSPTACSRSRHSRSRRSQRSARPETSHCQCLAAIWWRFRACVTDAIRTSLTESRLRASQIRMGTSASRSSASRIDSVS